MLSLSKHLLKIMPKTAIILGATGLVGGKLLEMLLRDDDYTKLKLFSRSSCKIDHPKIEEHLINLFELETHSSAFTGDVVFCCIGTTKAKTSDKEKYREIDYGIPVTAAIVAKNNGIKTFEVISAMGANPKSKTFYNKTKGEMERDVLGRKIEGTYIFQPSLLGGERNEKRFGERMAQFFMGAFSFLIPQQYKIIEPETIAMAMIKVARTKYGKQRIPSDEIKEIAST